MRHELRPAPSTYRETVRKAQKHHRCEADCGQVIEPGQRYVEATGVWDGGRNRFRLHRWCMDLYWVVFDRYEYDGLAFDETFDGAFAVELLSPWQPRVEASEEAAA